jgi:hypothetical protein
MEILKHHIMPITCISVIALWARHVTGLLEITTAPIINILSKANNKQITRSKETGRKKTEGKMK